MFRKEEPDLEFVQKIRLFLAVHWKGTICFAAPLILIASLAPLPPDLHQWVFYTYLLMAVFWMTECIPLEITSFLPVFIFPLTGVMTTSDVCNCYVNAYNMLLLGVLFMAFALQQSGLLKRVALIFILEGVLNSHVMLLLLIIVVSFLLSSFIPNTVVVAVMVPIVLNVLEIYENQGVLKVYDYDAKGEQIASDITTCYLCTLAFSASIGGVCTTIGTATNIAYRSIFHTIFFISPDYLAFLRYFPFGIVLAIALEILLFVYMIIMYFGVFRSASVEAKKAEIPAKRIVAIKKAIADEKKKLAPFSIAEGLSLLFFLAAVLLFLTRSSPYFTGWDKLIEKSFGVSLDLTKIEEGGTSHETFVNDSVPAMLICVIMFLVPSSLMILKNFTVKVHEELPKTPVPSLLHWSTLNAAIPFSFIFLIGGETALIMGMKGCSFVQKLDENLKVAADLHPWAAIFIIVLIVIILTNLASNVVVANLIVPVVTRWGLVSGVNPLWYCITAGCTASFGFLLPIACPGNLMVYRAAKIPLKKMVIAGTGPTVTTLLLAWVLYTFFLPVLYHDIVKLPQLPVIWPSV